MEEWTSVATATEPAEVRASMGCQWVAGTMGLKEVAWMLADMVEVQESATPTSIKTLTVEVASADLISAATATAK